MNEIEQISRRGHANAVEVIVGRLESSHGADCGQLGRGGAERPRGDLCDAPLSVESFRVKRVTLGWTGSCCESRLGCSEGWSYLAIPPSHL